MKQAVSRLFHCTTFAQILLLRIPWRGISRWRIALLLISVLGIATLRIALLGGIFRLWITSLLWITCLRIARLRRITWLWITTSRYLHISWRLRSSKDVDEHGIT